MVRAAYGTWPSPLPAATVAAAGRRITDIAVDGQEIYWGETRPLDGGRVTILHREPGGVVHELIAAPYSARTRVHEYGGGAITAAGGTLYFSNFADQRLYRVRSSGTPEPITPARDWRYADGVVDKARDRLVCVREDHTGGGHEPGNEIVAIDLRTGEFTVLASGADFYASPRLSPDGKSLCWIEWSHPNMPWDGTRLMTACFSPDGTLAAPVQIAGGETEAITGPRWSPSGVLHFVSDRTGWWNLYRRTGSGIEPLWPCAAEFGIPHWTFGTSMYAFDGADIVCIHGTSGAWRLAVIPANGGAPRPIDLPYTELSSLHVSAGKALLIAASPTASPALIAVDLARGTADVVREPASTPLLATSISQPEAITFPSTRGEAHAFFYPPHNPGYEGLAAERPPLVVIGHGGPTGNASTAFSAGIQFWTTRGFAVLDVDYGGSTGHGRAYRERLAGAWGLTDVEDCIAGARHLVQRGDVDGQRLLIRGGSAGGYTTLCALTFHDVFRAGASHYGIGDLEALAKDTHKFESRYLEKLVGPYPARRDLYVARSPIHHIDRLARPVIFFQGLEDKVVPPEQAETMVAALRAKGLPVAYVPFAGEQHGFRRAENIVAALEGELYFYGRVLGFTPADALAPIPIDNL